MRNCAAVPNEPALPRPFGGGRRLRQPRPRCGENDRVATGRMPAVLKGQAIDMKTRMNTSAPAVRLGLRRWLALGSALTLLIGAAAVADAQGLVKGVQEGAAAGNKAAGPVGGVLGGAIGGVVGVFTGVLGVCNNGKQGPPPQDLNKELSKEAAQKPQQGARKEKEGQNAKAG